MNNLLILSCKWYINKFRLFFLTVKIFSTSMFILLSFKLRLYFHFYRNKLVFEYIMNKNLLVKHISLLIFV